MKSTGGNWIEFQAQINEIAALDAQAMPFPWSLATWQNLKTSWDQYYLNYQSGDTNIQSFALWHTADLDCAHLLKVVVASSYRGQGLGLRLLEDCIEVLSLRNFKTCYLEVGVLNSPAIKIYDKLGFKKIREIKSFYSDGTNAYAMQLILN